VSEAYDRPGDNREGFVWRQAGCADVDSNHSSDDGFEAAGMALVAMSYRTGSWSPCRPVSAPVRTQEEAWGPPPQPSGKF
jgi:hypothetical protein